MITHEKHGMYAKLHFNQEENGENEFHLGGKDQTLFL